MMKEDKINWKCNSCIRNTRDINTPVTTRPRALSPLCNDKTPQNNFIINVSTENSFETLDSNETVDSPAIAMHTINRSCPDLRVNSLESIDQLQNKVLQLQEKLLIADNQIDILVQENYQLKDDISKCESKIKQLSDICKSDLKNVTHRKKRKTPKKTQLDFSVQDTEQSFIQDIQYANTDSCDQISKCNTSTQTSENITDGQPKTVSDINSDTITSSSKNKTYRSSDHYKRKSASPDVYMKLFENDVKFRMKSGLKKRKIVIMSDQQGKQLGVLLHQRYGEYFDILSHTAPGASTKNVLQPLLNMNSSLGKDDFLIILCGMNDKNPDEFFANIYSTMQRHETTNVLISQVPFNPYLSENKLNDIVKHISNQFMNSEVIDSNYNGTFTISHKQNIIHKLACKLYKMTYLECRMSFDPARYENEPAPNELTKKELKATRQSPENMTPNSPRDDLKHDLPQINNNIVKTAQASSNFFRP